MDIARAAIVNIVKSLEKPAETAAVEPVFVATAGAAAAELGLAAGKTSGLLGVSCIEMSLIAEILSKPLTGLHPKEAGVTRKQHQIQHL